MVSLCLGLNDIDNVLNTLLKLNNSVNECKEGIVFATSYIDAWSNVGATLTNNNLTSLNRLTTVNFGAKALRLGIAAVTR